jgi:hypothetical protein
VSTAEVLSLPASFGKLRHNTSLSVNKIKQWIKCKNTASTIESKEPKCNRQFQLLDYAFRGWWEVRYHIADNAEKIEMVAM